MAFEWQYLIDIRPTWVNRAQAANWEASVRTQLQTIVTVQTGRILLNSIRFWNKWVVITHYDFSQGACNAFADDLGGTARDGLPYGAVVKYSPHLYFHGGACAFARPNDAAGAHEILFHELTHAFRRVSSKRNPSATTGAMSGYDTNEEFDAILLTNIFLSDPSNKYKTGLRKDHQDHSPLGADLATSFNFFQSSMNAFDLVNQLCSDHPDLTGAVAKVKAPFNPIAAFFQDRAKAQRLSLSAKALIRDAESWAQVIRSLWPF